MHRSLRGVDGLGNTTQKHCYSSDVLTSPSELWEIVPLVHDVMLDLTGATRQAMRMGRNVLYRAHRCRWRLVLPPLL